LYEELYEGLCNKVLSSPRYAAARDDDRPAVMRLLAAGAEPNARAGTPPEPFVNAPFAFS
jgi:hypothetical protein